MRLVRLGKEPSATGADIRAAVSAWGQGCGVLGGVALFGCTPPGSPRPLDAVLLLPRGVIAVIGIDLPEPALKLEAPLRTPWTVDGWPLVRPAGAVNPGLDALEAASALARTLQSRSAEPMPVGTIVAVGPFVEQVTQPTSDLHRGMRVVHPSTTAMLAATRELATYERDCSVEPARHLLSSLDRRAAELGVTELTDEGFPDAVAPDLASADTMLIAKVGDASRDSPTTAAPDTATSASRPWASWKPRSRPIALSVVAVVLLGVLGLLVFGGTDTRSSPEPRAVVRMDGVEFTQRSTQRTTECARHSFGDVQAWLSEHPCSSLSRTVFGTRVSGRDAVVAVTVVEVSRGQARELQEILNTVGSGGIRSLLAEGSGSDGARRPFGDGARAVRRTGDRVRIVRATWSNAPSNPENVKLRALTERGMRLPAAP